MDKYNIIYCNIVNSKASCFSCIGGVHVYLDFDASLYGNIIERVLLKSLDNKNRTWFYLSRDRCNISEMGMKFLLGKSAALFQVHSFHLHSLSYKLFQNVTKQRIFFCLKNKFRFLNSLIIFILIFEIIRAPTLSDILFGTCISLSFFRI